MVRAERIEVAGTITANSTANPFMGGFPYPNAGSGSGGDVLLYADRVVVSGTIEANAVDAVRYEPPNRFNPPGAGAGGIGGGALLEGICSGGGGAGAPGGVSGEDGGATDTRPLLLAGRVSLGDEAVVQTLDGTGACTGHLALAGEAALERVVAPELCGGEPIDLRALAVRVRLAAGLPTRNDVDDPDDDDLWPLTVLLVEDLSGFEVVTGEVDEFGWFDAQVVLEEGVAYRIQVVGPGDPAADVDVGEVLVSYGDRLRDLVVHTSLEWPAEEAAGGVFSPAAVE